MKYKVVDEQGEEASPPNEWRFLLDLDGCVCEASERGDLWHWCRFLRAVPVDAPTPEQVNEALRIWEVAKENHLIDPHELFALLQRTTELLRPPTGDRWPV